MTRSDAEILRAVIRCTDGEITVVQCLREIRRAERLPDFLCQDARNWKQPPARSRCSCGNELKHQFEPCDQCRQEHAQIYEPNGRRRIFIQD